MASFSRRSNKVKATLCSDLVDVLDIAIRHIDFSLTDGARGKTRQAEAVKSRGSRAIFGMSPHNWNCSCCKDRILSVQAFDFVPYPVPPWNSKLPRDVKETYRRFMEVIVVFKAVGDALGVSLVSGESFSFTDLPHIEKANWLTDRFFLIDKDI